MKKYRVWWIDNMNGVRVDYGSYDRYEDAEKIVYELLAKFKTQPPYVRGWKASTKRSDDTTILDYGSHHCFYHIIEEGF